MGAEMKDLNIARSYVNLEKAGALLGVSAIDLIHGGAFNQVQICVKHLCEGCGLINGANRF